jgi:hypothetical protein
MIEWLSQTSILANWIILLYWISLGVPLIVMFILESKYYNLYFKNKAQLYSEKLKTK